MSLGKEHSCRPGWGQGLLIILCAWRGCVGGWCAVLASASSVCKCAVVVLTVHVSLWSRLFCGRKNDKKKRAKK